MQQPANVLDVEIRFLTEPADPLPVRPHSTGEAKADPDQRTAVPAGTSVLVVDDEPEVRLHVKFALQRAGIQVLEAEDGIEALRLLDTVKPDLILTDIKMLRMDGIALAQQVAQKSPGLPVLVMSGFVADHAEVKPGRFIRKPFLPKALVETVIRNIQPFR